MARRIQKAKIKFISLVPRGANNFTTIYKDADSTFAQELLVKDMSEQGELTAVVYAPEQRDRHGDIASAEVIKDMLYDAARTGFDIDFRHDNQPVSKDKAFVAQSFIVQKGDPRFAAMTDYSGAKVDVTGAWGVIIKIEDPELRKLYREKKWDGVSMGGSALMQADKQDAPNDGDEDMTDAQVANLAKALVEGLTTVLKPEKKKEETAPAAPVAKTDEVPAYKGDGSVKSIRKHALNVQKDEVLKSIDWKDAASVDTATTALAEIEKSLAELEAEQTDDANATPEQREIKRLEKQIGELRGRSNQPVTRNDSKPGNGNTKAAPYFVGLTKTDDTSEEDIAKEVSTGRAMANLINTRRGFVTPAK